MYVARCQLRAAKREKKQALDLLRVAEEAAEHARDAVSIAVAATSDAHRVVKRLERRFGRK